MHRARAMLCGIVVLILLDFNPILQIYFLGYEVILAQ